MVSLPCRVRTVSKGQIYLSSIKNIVFNLQKGGWTGNSVIVNDLRIKYLNTLKTTQLQMINFCTIPFIITDLAVQFARFDYNCLIMLDIFMKYNRQEL